MSRTHRRRSLPGRAGPAPSLERIAADRTSSASVLADEALSALAERFGPAGTTPAIASPAELRRVASRLERAQPSMGPFLRWAVDLRRLARIRGSTSRARQLLWWVRTERRRLATETPRIARLAGARLPSRARVVTLSRSETVRRALAGTSGVRRPIAVAVLESRPGGEGRRMAHELRAIGLPARWVPDRAAPRAVAASDAVMIGADAIYGDGTVVHKVGTRRLAVAAGRAGVPVFVLAGSSKWVPRPHPPRRLRGPFDRTPVALVGEYWTERGVIPGLRSGSGTGGRQREASRGPRPGRR
jgi:translation initiation factor 2B subunit (eIF-2B alpha/beta/delta family)